MSQSQPLTAKRQISHPNPVSENAMVFSWGSTNAVSKADAAPAAPKGKVTFILALTAFTAAFGSSFPHGWNTGVLNAPSQLIKDFLNTTFTERFDTEPSEAVVEILWATTVSIYLVGGCAGAFSAGWFADRFGRKKALLICHTFGFLGSILFAFCNMASSFEMLILGRLIVGYGCGAGSGLVPMYLTELAPINIRGAMGIVHQFALTCGILSSNIFGLRQVLGHPDRWPFLLAATAVPMVFSSIVLPFCPESPRYILFTKNQKMQAEKALKKLRGTPYVRDDLREMEMEQEKHEEDPEWTFKQLLSSKVLRLPLILVCSLACSQQLSGINIVFYYSTDVFQRSGIPDDKIQYAVLATGLVNVIMTGISIPMVERFGRRPLLLNGMVLMIISATVLTIALNLMSLASWLSYFSIIGIVTFVVGFAIGLGSIPQFIGAELFKQGPRPPAMSFAGFLNWLCNFIVGISFPLMEMVLGPFSFIIFIVINIFFVVFLFIKLPETKNKSIEEIYRLFASGSDKNGRAETDEILHMIPTSK